MALTNIYGGDFLEAPSKEKLASVLTDLAAFVYDDDQTSMRLVLRNLPWPLLACLNSCTSGTELIELANRVSEGDLGDVDDWIAAEMRWGDQGVTRDDLIYMSDRQLPFDTKIGKIGFPTSISMTHTVLSPDVTIEAIEEVLGIFEALPPGPTRSFVAKTINWLLFSRSLPPHFSPESPPSKVTLQDLTSVYREIPAGSPIPIHMIISLFGQSIQELSAFLNAIRSDELLFASHIPGRRFSEESVRTSIRAYMDMNEDPALLPLLGIMAEEGHLADKHVDIKCPGSLEGHDTKLAALIVTLSQEKWITDRSEKLIASSQEAIGGSGNVFKRILTTLEKSRPTGIYVDRFVIALRNLIPQDDYTANQRYIDLLEDVLGRRTSTFSELDDPIRFALPEGIIASLRR